MYKVINCQYDKESLISLFNKSNKAMNKIMWEATDFDQSDPTVLNLYEKFNFVPYTPKNMTIGVITKNVNPYINPSNNGLIIFPLQNVLEVSFYSHPGVLVDGRPTLVPEWRNQSQLDEIKSTHVETIQITQPTIINGLVAHSYQIANDNVLICVLKIPMSVSWEEVYMLTEQLHE